MRNRPSSHLVFTVCLILAFSLIAAGCAPIPAAAPPVGADQPPAVVASVDIVLAAPPTTCQPLSRDTTTPYTSTVTASDCFVDKQVLVTGLASYFASRPTSLLPLTPLQTIDLSELIANARRRNDSLQVPHFPQVAGGDSLKSVLYAMPPSDRRTVGDLIAEIDEEAKGDRSAEPKAYADPNYLIGEPSLEGHPNGVVGSPFADAAGAPGGFADQWAFEQIGLVTPASSGTAEAGGIPLGVFDTFPVSLMQGSARGVTFRVRHDTDIKASLTMCVKSPTGHANIIPVRSEPIADHGVFAAYMAQAVAPHSKITLYRVLNEYGDGDLATLDESINDFVSAVAPSGPGVINLSLGLHWYPESVWPDRCGRWRSNLETNEGLDAMLGLMRESGFVVVAAAGNDASNAGPNPRVVPPDSPASSPDAIGVAASNSVDGGKLACFSNIGDGLVLAPGGDGRHVSQGKCENPLGDCDQNPDVCENESLISLMPSSETGYGYWTGTSFAVPLVSGLAAKCLEANGGQWQGIEASQGISNAISSGAVPTNSMAINGRVLTLKTINVPNTLTLCNGASQ